jgi:hypothetical protein
LFALNIGTNGTTTGKLFNILDTASSIFSVSETQVTTSLPASFTAPGDVSIAYDINFTNPTASYIKSAAPLYMVSGETFNSSDLTLQTYNSGNIVLQPGSSGFVTATTNVGIGTVSPAARLELSGDTASQIMGTTYSNSTNPGFIGRRASGTAASPGVLNNGDLITFFGGRSYNGTGFTTTTTAYMGIWAGETWSSTNQGSYMTFVTTPTGSTTSAERMRITAAGNVGIGTTSPGTNFQIGNTSNFRFGTDFTGSVFGGGSRSAWTYTNGTGTVYSQLDASHNAYFGTLSNHPLILQTNGTNAVTISTAGNVGIGTTSPGQLLHAQLNDSGTNVLTDVLRLDHLTSGTAANGLGTGLFFVVEGASGTSMSSARIGAININATEASYKSGLVFYTNGGSLTEKNAN